MLYLIISFVVFVAAVLATRHLKVGIPEAILMVITVVLAWPLISIAGLFYLVFDCFYQAHKIIFGEDKV